MLLLLQIESFVLLRSLYYDTLQSCLNELVLLKKHNVCSSLSAVVFPKSKTA